MANDNGDRTSSRLYQKIPTRLSKSLADFVSHITDWTQECRVTLTKLTKTLMHQKNKEGGFINL